MNKKLYGLKRQSVIALLISILMAVIIFEAVDCAATIILEKQMDKGLLVKEKSMDYIDLFESYVTENNISSTDKTKLDNWVNSQKSATAILFISRNGKAIYDSLQSIMQDDSNSKSDSQELLVYVGEDYSSNKWFNQREIIFADGPAVVSLYAYYNQWIYNLSFILAIGAGVITLIACFLFFMRRKINAILKLEEDIKILETGGLKHKISSNGNDEIASLAGSLNRMRLSLIQNINEENEYVKTNYNLVVSISHDIRTPLTALALYIDLILNEKYSDKEEMFSFLTKGRAKVTQIKEMTDNLFERFYLEKNTSLEEAKSINETFAEPVLNFSIYLKDNGFKVSDTMQWSGNKITASKNYIKRIFDNLATNIIKYANPNSTVTLLAYESGNSFVISIKNEYNGNSYSVDSNGIGIENVKSMMEKMNGELIVLKNEEYYISKLVFKVADYAEYKG